MKQISKIKRRKVYEQLLKERIKNRGSFICFDLFHKFERELEFTYTNIGKQFPEFQLFFPYKDDPEGNFTFSLAIPDEGTCSNEIRIFVLTILIQMLK